VNNNVDSHANENLGYPQNLSRTKSTKIMFHKKNVCSKLRLISF